SYILLYIMLWIPLSLFVFPYTTLFRSDFIAYISERGIAINGRKRQDLLELIQTDIEAIVGRYYFGRSAYFKVKNRTDDFSLKNKDRKSTRLNSSHVKISYAVFCLIKKI